MYFETEATWFLLNTLLDWVKVLAATHIGFRLVGAYAGRVRLGSGQRALQGRVRELEQATEELRGQLEEVLEAERFATALRQTSSERLSAPCPRGCEAPSGVRVP
jgi:hypothetical protein